MSRRILRVNSLIKNKLGQIILKEIDFPSDTLVSIIGVETSKDLLKCKVFISIIPEENVSLVFKILNSEIYKLQKQLNKLLKFKYVPKIEFVREKGISESVKINKILDEIQKEKD